MSCSSSTVFVTTTASAPTKTSNKQNELLVKKINAAKNIYLCPSLVKDKYIIRFAVCAKSSTVEDIEYSWREIKRLGDQVLLESNEDKFKNMALHTTYTEQNGKLNGKINLPVCSINRSASEISVVNLPRLVDLKTAYTNLLEAAGEDIQREGLLKTPERAAKAFQFFTAGYHTDIKGKSTSFL